MPGFIGQKLCPELVIIRPNFEKYTAKSEQVRAVFAEYDPNYSTMSLDEAYLDITEHLETRRFSTEDERTFPGYSHPELVCRCRSNSGMYISCCCFLMLLQFQIFFVFGFVCPGTGFPGTAGWPAKCQKMHCIETKLTRLSVEMAHLQHWLRAHH